MITILMVLQLNFGSVTIDVGQTYGLKTIEECQELAPEMQKIFNASVAYCAVGDILNPVEEI
jgi:hypothetical protein